MTKLEFINEEIKIYEYKIKKLKEEQVSHINYSCKDNSIICNYEIEECQNRLNILNQIKQDLKAWEVCKRNIDKTPFFYVIAIERNNENDCKDFEKAMEVK